MHSQWSGVGYDLVVVGAGASGALVTAQHVRQGKPGRLALIGVGPGAGRGVAYDTPFRSNLLNVPAWNMSAFPDDPGHFQRWLAARTPGADQGTFAPRMVYGAYLEELLAEALNSPLVTPVPPRAVDLAREGEGGGCCSTTGPPSPRGGWCWPSATSRRTTRCTPIPARSPPTTAIPGTPPRRPASRPPRRCCSSAPASR
ncbi:MAG: FAD/NAD(P)-binding protein [Gemmatimonadetes bacterium]|nr:FAD/NAD(P)-binding protein [Gemmatimonadota bacterium]